MRSTARLAATCGAALAALLIVLLAPVRAAEPFEALEDPELQARYAAIIQEVRCLTCLNRSIAESETPLAHDLRREIRELIASGKSDREVVDFLTARYGEFVMYRPPMGPRTWALWFAPAVFLGVGAIVFGLVVRRRIGQPIDDDETDDETDEIDEEGRDASHADPATGGPR